MKRSAGKVSYVQDPQRGVGSRVEGFAKKMLAFLATRWTATISFNDNLPHVIIFRALCGAKFATRRSDI